jgi:GntR family transcriptional regulator
VEKRRGLGMFVKPGARRNLMKNEREQFLKNEWPLIVQRIQRLDLDTGDLLKAADEHKGEKS